MATILIRNASLFSPDPLGTNDILIINDRIAAIAQNVSVPEWLGPVQEMNGKGLFAVPGFIDAHVHITGGGGEAGFSSQVPPLPLSKLIRSGVTTVGGLLGTDGVTRHVDAVLAKANSLEEEGISSFIMSEGLSWVFAALERAPHLGRHLIATHINRSPFAFSEAAKLVAKGGFMDISSGLNVQTLGPETLKPSEAIALAMRQGVAKERILMSSDGNGSAARYGDDGSVSGLVASDLGSLHTEFADCVKEGMPLSEALCPITHNVAQAFSLSRKGHIAVGADADILLLAPDLALHTVIARGECMMREGTLCKKGTFEE